MLWRSLLLAFLLSGSSVLHAGTIRLTPDSTTVDVGDEITLQIEGTDFLSEPLDGGALSVLFDPLVLQVLSVSVDGSVWDFATDPGLVDNVAGVVGDIFFLAFTTLPEGSFPIGAIQFLAIGGGDSTIGLTASVLSPFSSLGEVIEPTFESAIVTVRPPSTVPLPLAAVLLASGLAGLAPLRRRRRA